MTECPRPIEPVRRAAFEIYLAWSDRTLHVSAEDSALRALVAAGIPIEAGCELGSCGSCVTPYVEGDLVHLDSVLSLADRERYFCPCVTRAATRVVLAL